MLLAGSMVKIWCHCRFKSKIRHTSSLN